ncbi:dicarboxylate/amino acid:cation symporter [uncultured Victivallis sp.]|uniref:dicarboxylate/amino acid:cation symporter n=1 Tax=uncultured Victivallis sp. TaxID=354118 RepID=UPI0025EA979B|nr:dicarboxylate/amino acid:cation symporter [uncultured Victivallis sp.]
MKKNQTNTGFNGRQFALWMAALVLGGILGTLNIGWLNDFFNFIASVYTRLFQFVAVPTIALAVTTTLALLGTRKNTGRIFLHTIVYTLLTTAAAALVGLLLFKVIEPGNLPADVIQQGNATVPENLGSISYYSHILSVIPNNILAPFSSGNVLSILLVAVAVGLVLALKKESENIQVLLKGILGMQEVLFALIRALVWTLPLGIVAFAAQLSAQVSAGFIIGSLGKYVAVVLGGNLIQSLIVLPLFLLIRGINPLRVFRCMLPAVLMALFTKSSAATLPVTVASAENNLKAKEEVARFVLPICCTINMNGCAAFILVTSLFVMQNGGWTLSLPTVALWFFISIISAIGNAGVPMGCYFLTLSLMSGIHAPIGILGIILPIYTIIDMIETAENVWSDSCVCAMVNKTMTAADPTPDAR